MKSSLESRSVFRFIGRFSVLAFGLASASWANSFFGTVVPIGGHASDIALDEGRGVLYIANYTANRVEVMNTADRTIPTSINVPFPGSLALSRDGKYLVVASYSNFVAPSGQNSNILTIITLDTNVRRTVALSKPPLAVQFGFDGLALVLTTTEFLLLDPASGDTILLDTVAGVAAKTLPVPSVTFPPQILTASMGVSGDGQFIFGITDTISFGYSAAGHFVSPGAYSASPALGPRLVSVNNDGSLFVAGWAVYSATLGPLSYQFYDVSGALNIGSHAIDSAKGLIYAQIPDSGPAPGAPTTQTVCFPDGRCVTETIPPPPGTGAPTLATPPNLMVADLDNLNVRQRFFLAENLAGRSVLSSNGATLYSISDSGVTVFPVGSIAQAPQVIATQEDVVFQGAFCDRRTLTQDIRIEGSTPTDFRLSIDDPALARLVTFSATSGTTPATVRVTIDTTSFQTQVGTTVGFIRLESNQAVNLQQLNCPAPSNTSSWPAGCIRMLINNREPDQRGTIVNVPGRLVDLLADPVRNRFYIVRQDRNQVLVFDGANNSQIATLRVNNNPTQMAITSDSKYLLVGHSDAKIVSVFDLDTLTESDPIRMPSYLYPRSVAVAGNTILTASRSARGDHEISLVDFESRTAVSFPTLGVFKNSVNVDTILVSAPRGNYIMAAMPDGNVLLYDASAGTFTISRKDFASLAGAYAANEFGQFAIDNKLLNQSLSRVAELDRGQGGTSGFVFLGNSVLRTSGPVTTGTAAPTTGVGFPGLIERVDLNNPANVLATRTIEAPRFPTASAAGSTVTSGGPTTAASAFIRSLAVLANGGTIISLTQSGFVTLPSNFDATTAKPVVTSVVDTNSGDPKGLTAGGLITINGSNLASGTVSSSGSPAPTMLGGSCVTINGQLIPLFLVSPPKINGQLPLGTASGQLVVHTPGGSSDPFNITTQSTAPSVIQVPTAPGSADLISNIIRVDNGLPVNFVNPIHKGDHLYIFASGLGPTSPAVPAGTASPSNPPAVALLKPTVVIDGATCPVLSTILDPGQIGIYRIEVTVPQGIQQGYVALYITQGGVSSAPVTVRVVQ